MRRRIFNTRFVSSLVASVMMIAGVTAATAQRNANRYSRNDVAQVVANLEASSNAFTQAFAYSLDRSNINGTREEDRLNRIVQNYETALDRLRSEFDTSDSWWESRRNVQGVMDNARQVNDMMMRLQFARQLERQWRDMRRDINLLAQTYELPGVAGGTGGGGMGGGNWNNNPGWNDGNVDDSGPTSRPPNWATGTFYSTNGTGISMSIDNGGRVTVMNGGEVYYGRFYNGQIYLNNDVSTISRFRNGLRTYNRNLRQYTEYSRTRNQPYGGNNSPGWGGGGAVSAPPSWAVGTFYSTNGSDIAMTIDRSGRVTVVNGGETFYGTYNNGSIFLNNDMSTVTRRGNGIRTFNRNTGQTTDYSPTFNSDIRGGVRGGGQLGSTPPWAVGRFYGRNPETGSVMTLEIQNNGETVLSMDGNVYSGFVNGSQLTLNNDTSQIQRINGGIRTVRTDTGQVTEYLRRLR